MHKEKLVILSILLCALLLSSCATPTVQPTPTPTRTPKPTLTPTPNPTPTPAYPVSVGCQPAVLESACTILQSKAAEQPNYFSWSDDPATAAILLGGADIANNQVVGNWTYLLVAPFMTIPDTITYPTLQASWSGDETRALQTALPDC